MQAVPTPHQERKVKNVSISDMGEKLGRIHMEHQVGIDTTVVRDPS